jgi:diadenosine tetraphosphate (Ap4A) HIT family hydrolase
MKYLPDCKCFQAIDVLKYIRKEPSKFFADTSCWFIGLNPKKSPFPFRTCVLLKRHLEPGEAQHGLGALNEQELEEFSDINKKINYAIKKALENSGIKIIRVQNFVKSACSSHIDFDFMPLISESPYGDETLIRSHSKSEEIPIEEQEKQKNILEKLMNFRNQ